MENGADVNPQNELGYTPLHLACASNNPKYDHSSKLEEYLIEKGAEVDALNNECETPLMMLFKLDREDEIISKSSKYDPITTLMVFLKNKADINFKSKSKKTPLHYACIRGSTISALTLINNGADCNAQDYSETTPYGYAMKNNHEDLCIFLIQQGNLIDVTINSVVMNSEHECNQINSLQAFANSPEIDELFRKKSVIDRMPNYRKIEENYCKLESYSPFYYAIKNNMQGNIYLLIQKGFNQYSALAESIMQNKFNLFISLLDVVDEDTVRNGTDKEGKNLIHVFAKYVKSVQIQSQVNYEQQEENQFYNNRNRTVFAKERKRKFKSSKYDEPMPPQINYQCQDTDFLDNIYAKLIEYGVNPEAKDKLGRIPLHYAFENGNMYVSKKLLSGMNEDAMINTLNTEDDSNVTCFGMLFAGLADNSKRSNPLTPDVISLIGQNIRKLNPFVRFIKKEFPYTQLGYSLEDQEMIHPLILLNDI